MTDIKFLAVLGERIKKLRLKKSITQMEPAMLCGFEKESMSRIESGKTNITVPTPRKICKGLDVEITEFFKD
jgi:transcriptional regulator with XRE-family HTH domain